jgi:hypothetical protein
MKSTSSTRSTSPRLTWASTSAPATGGPRNCSASFLR